MDNFNPQAVFIVITVFILFVNKVVEMMKAKQAAKAARQDRQERREQSPRRPLLREAQRPPQRQRQSQRQRQQQPPASAPASPFQDVLTELFEAAGVPPKLPEQQPSPTLSTAPPPIPQSRSVIVPKLSKEEREALDRLERRGERSIENRRRQRRAASDKITKLLLSKDAARQAIIVAEILGPPRGMKDIEYR